jgi:membrane protein CcdC involved in cytochrome C biogenesis
MHIKYQYSTSNYKQNKYIYHNINALYKTVKCVKQWKNPSLQSYFNHTINFVVIVIHLLFIRIQLTVTQDFNINHDSLSMYEYWINYIHIHTYLAVRQYEPVLLS